MNKVILLWILSLIPLTQYGQIIADHTVVDKFDKIPSYYINEVKKMYFDLPGESHATGVFYGIGFVEQNFPSYDQNGTQSGVPESYTSEHLRVGWTTWGDYSNPTGWISDNNGGNGYGEEDWFTNSTAITRTKAGLSYMNSLGLTPTAFGFGWCSDMDVAQNWENGVDPVYGCHWYGASNNGPQGNKGWGLDGEDNTITGNTVNLDTYLSVTQQYIDYCIANNIPTKVFFTTGPVSNYTYTNEQEYQGWLKMERIRNYVKADPTRILFDYADILSYNDDGTSATRSWNGHTFPCITATNLGAEDYGHIGRAGCLRLGKAVWWMLARIAGWDGGTTSIPVASISVTGAGGATTITTDNGTLQLSASVLPADATNKTVTWSISGGSDKASISTAGLVTALDNGTATARATANDGSGVFGELTITITNQLIPVSSITVTGAGGATTITTDNGTLQLSAAVLPANATNKTVTWSISSGTDKASISSAGLVTALDNGTTVARATANDGSGVYGTLTITITSQVIPVNGITVTGAGGATTITTDNGTLQLSAAVLPANATNKTVTWSITIGTDKASISSAGLVTALDNGTAVARATANDGTGVYGELTITITNQVIPVTSITVTGAGGATTIATDDGTLQLSAAVLPANATNKMVTWSISGGTDKASISTTGLVTALDNGTAIARATANDGSGIYGTLTITITNQIVPVTGITVTGAGGATGITTDNGTLQLSATVLPANATNKTVTWSISSGADKASISSTGLVTAFDNGTAEARATANDGTGVYGTLTITITNQVIPVSNITVTGAGGATTITTDDGTLQLSAAVFPVNATNKTVTWSITSGVDLATINSSGLLTAIDNGVVTVRAIANDGSGIFGTIVITITNQVIPVTGITVTGAGGSTSISTDNGTLQLSASVSPSNATNQAVTWSISSGTDKASISSTGLVTALDNGTTVARATANDGSGVYGTLTIMISNQVIPVTSITVTGAGGATTITTDNGTLQLSAEVLPANATNKSVTWTITSGTDKASISSTGLVTALDNGTAVARASANDGSGVFGTLTITITNQTIPVSSITVTGAGGSSLITTLGGTLQLSAEVSPINATDQSVTWTLVNGTGEASINTTGLVTAISSGTATAIASANDGSGVKGTLMIKISDEYELPFVAIVHDNEMRLSLDEKYVGSKISLYNLNGHLVYSKLADCNLCIFDISYFHPGLYIVVLSDKLILKVIKVIIP